jgi:type 1 glutamine amidotransferase
MLYHFNFVSILIVAFTFGALSTTALAAHPNGVVWEGDEGPGKGKHIVFIAGDHEYRGEESLPALARIMAKHYGFKCSFFVTTNPKDGTINPGSNHITGLEALKTADLMVVFTRFQAFKDDQMQHIEDYLATGKPVIGLRTSTHGFKGLKGKFAKYNEGYNGAEKEWKAGFGEAILGEHWVGHYGRNHRQSSRLQLDEKQLEHPVLRGVKDVHTQCGGYNAHPREGSTVLARGQILNGMKFDSPPDPSKNILPVAWVRNYKADDPKSRVFATTHGASEDILNEGFRRMLVNAHLWCLGMDDAIKAGSNVSFVGPYNPVTFNFGGYRKGVKPADIEGFDTPILGKK